MGCEAIGSGRARNVRGAIYGTLSGNGGSSGGEEPREDGSNIANSVVCCHQRAGG